MINTVRRSSRKVSLLMEVLFSFRSIDLKGGYRFAGNPEEIFERFFGTANPFAQLIGSYIRMSLDGDGREAHGSLFSHAFGA
jgi:DnaJ family protein B protein 13